MTTRREILLQGLDAWRAEEALDEATYRFLRSRYEATPAGGELDEPLLPAAGAASEGRVHTAGEHARGGSFASDAMQFVGGLLLGAALVALVAFMGAEEEVAQWILFAMGAGGLAVGVAAAMFAGEGRRGLVEAAFAAGFVPLGVAAGFAIGNESVLGGVLVTLAAVGAHVFERGRGASIVLAAVVVSLGTFALTFQGDPFAMDDALVRAAWLALLLGYLALTLAWRREGWSSAAAGVLVFPLVGAFLLLLDAMATSPDSVMMELLVGAFLGALLGVGIWLGARGLVATSAAGLTIDAVVFAFDIGGPGTAVVLLLALGALLVWQGGMVRAYFARRADRHLKEGERF